MNRIILIGRLTRDPELRYTNDGTAVAGFGLAVDRPWVKDDDQQSADFVNIVVWRKQAESVANLMKKGKQVAVEGRLQIRNYENKEGEKRTATEVVADRVMFLGKKDDGEFDKQFDDAPF